MKESNAKNLLAHIFMKNGKVLSKNVGIYNENELKQMIQKFNK